MTLEAMDYDEGVNAQIVFESVEMPKDDLDRELFQLLADGEIRTLLSNSLNREEKDFYTAVVRARDSGNPPLVSGE